jgi:hypothetical protein
LCLSAVKISKIVGLPFILFAVLSGSLQTSKAGATSIQFSLDEPCKTSAGVYLPDGTLVRTLWSKVRYDGPGAYSALWDGLDDSGDGVPSRTYEVKLLQHNTEYVWDGAIGNTSAEASGYSVHTAFRRMRDMAITGGKAFYVVAYNEAKYDFHTFQTTDPHRIKFKWNQPSGSGGTFDRDWNWTATDGQRVYFACPAGSNPTNFYTNNYPGFILASFVNDYSDAYFTSGVKIPNGNGCYTNGVYVGTQPGLSGLAVQRNGPWLAASVKPDNRVYLLNKLSGSAGTTLALASPGRMSFSPDGSLWVISSTNVVCLTNMAQPKAATTISTLAQPLAVAVNPANPNLILVADGGSSQQIKAFDQRGVLLWVYGLPGGYQSNGPRVANNKFWFSNGQFDDTFLCFDEDGSFWVGDGANNRYLHFSAQRTYLEQIMYQPHSYMACVDQNNPTRVFNQFLEFSVDYTKPLAQSWTLVNNWKANVDPCHIGHVEGIREVTTFPNGRTYALVDNNCVPGRTQEICELTEAGLRLTGIHPFGTANASWVSLGTDGSALLMLQRDAKWYRATLLGFEANGNPRYGAPTLIGSAPNGAKDPVPRCCSIGFPRATISTNNIIISFDPTLNNGWHLGGVRVGATNWLWKASPSGTLNGEGAFEIAGGVTYAGNTMQAVDRHVMYGYHGEFFRGQGQASQHMHFYDNGLFLGQFGEASPGHATSENPVPGSVGNGANPSLVRSETGGYYLWVNDESAHGPQRWHFVNAGNICEHSGKGELGGTITLTSPPADFPTGLVGMANNQKCYLSWRAVNGADSYRIYYSRINGGPYTTMAGSTLDTNFVARGLVNGQAHYFSVVAVTGGVERTPSAQVEIFPFDARQKVARVGAVCEGGQKTPVLTITTSSDFTQPTFVGAERLTGMLNPAELCYNGFGDLMNKSIGSQGYVVFGWGGIGVHLERLSPAFTVKLGAGWIDVCYLTRKFKADNILGSDRGLTANPVGTIEIKVKDNNFHFLTVVSPSKFRDARKFTMGIVSTDGTSAAYSINEAQGNSHILQFLFKGNITLRADAVGGSLAIVQALFLDDAPPHSWTSPAPSGLRVAASGK